MQGNIIKREYFEWYNQSEWPAESMMKLIMSVDATFKETAKSDKVSIQIWGKRGMNMYLVDRVAGRMGFIATVQAIENMRRKYPQIVIMYIEDKANGSAIIDVLNRKFHGVVAVNPQGSKEARVHSILPFLEGKGVFLPRTPWAEEVVEQCASFPKGANDDDVDALSQAISKLSLMHAPVPMDAGKYDFTQQKPKASELNASLPNNYFSQ
jgi:predicted phage terminase large subunit-like protein